MRATLFVTFLLFIVESVGATQQAALQPEPAPQEIAQQKAVICDNAAAAKAVASVLQARLLTEEDVAAQDKCAVASLPNDMKTVVSIANEGAQIHYTDPAKDGRRTLFYELPPGPRNPELHPIFFVLLPADD